MAQKHTLKPSFTAALALGLALATGLCHAARQDWTLEPIEKSTAYSVSGQSVKQQQFGLVKHSNRCTQDELMLTLASAHPNVWGLAGKRVALRADFDGVEMTLPLEVIAIRPGAGSAHRIMLGHVFANSELISLISRAQIMALSVADDQFSEYFSSAGESFALAGFSSARDQADQRCQQQSG